MQRVLNRSSFPSDFVSSGFFFRMMFCFKSGTNVYICFKAKLFVTFYDESSDKINALYNVHVVILAPYYYSLFCSFLLQVNTAAYLQNAEWQFDSATVSTETMPACCPLSVFTMISFNFNFTRLRPFYVINLIVPAMLLSVCMVLTFLLPTECGERLGYSMTILLSYTVLMTITSEMMPTTSKETPHISMQYIITRACP